MLNTSPHRSWTMARVGQKDTKPEMVVRRLVHGMGYRFRLHRKDLPGSPDIVLPGLRKVIEVRGCFWHRHPDPSCGRARVPKTRQDFWIPKLERNAQRDAENERQLRALGWDLMVVWECQTTPQHRQYLEAALQGFLSG
ncbi:DNA mismatch endonuclease Vsr [Pelagibacterium lacus]|uniref:Very short patch repair endonuclease n=2 Tax=Pelagibacterium lacus TaxID=2282655 RepID=A0A369W1H7_9HYPH|nr:very short patch repair endonuclease [Pelagibacterium lacus]RDE07807.1 DNA mismatch endonuclease Vsr [Pelagibacterium lacus]